MDLDWLKDFQALAEHETFSRAAEARHVTQPAFSRRVRALEDWVGTPLFERSAHGAALTAAGLAFQPLALQLVRTLDRARREALATAEHQTSSLAIAATHALSFSFFPNWIRRHVDMESVGKLHLLSDTLNACEQAMLSGEVHFLICHYCTDMPLQFGTSDADSISIGRDVLTAVSAPDADGRPLWPIPGANQRARLLGYSHESGLGRILAASPEHKALRADSETVFTSHLAATLHAMARDGQGIAWLPLSLVAEDLQQGRLVSASKTALDVQIDIRLFRSTECRNRAADALWDSLERKPGTR